MAINVDKVNPVNPNRESERLRVEDEERKLREIKTEDKEIEDRRELTDDNEGKNIDVTA